MTGHRIKNAHTHTHTQTQKHETKKHNLYKQRLERQRSQMSRIWRVEMLPVVGPFLSSTKKSLLESSLETLGRLSVNSGLWEEIVYHDTSKEAAFERVSAKLPLHELLVVALVKQAGLRASPRRRKGEELGKLRRSRSKDNAVKDRKHRHVSASRQGCEPITLKRFDFGDAKLSQQAELHPVDLEKDSTRCVIKARSSRLKVAQHLGFV